MVLGSVGSSNCEIGPADLLHTGCMCLQTAWF